MSPILSKASWVLSGDIGARIAGFFITVYLARTFDTGGYGIIVVSLSVLGIALWFGDMGLNTLGTREVSRKPNHIYTVNQIFRAKLIMSCLAFFTTSIFIWTIFYDRFEMALIVQLFLFALFPHAITVEWFFNGLQKFKLITFSRMLQASVYLILLYIFTTEDTLYRVPLFYAASLFLAAIFLLKGYTTQQPLETLIKKAASLKSLIADGFKIGLGSLFAQFVILLPPLFAGYFLGSTQAGYYGAAFKIILLVMLIDRVLTTLLLPNLSRAWKKSRETAVSHLNHLLRLAVVFSSCATLVLFFGAETFISFIFGETYRQSAVILPVLSFFLPATFANSIFSYSLISTGMDKQYLQGSAAGGLVTFFLLLFISFIGNLSWIAFAVVISEISFMLFMFIKISKTATLRVQVPLLQVAVLIVMIMIIMIYFPNLPFAAIFILPFIYLLILGIMKLIEMDDLTWISKRIFK